jgi:hypothetical protein
VIRTNRTAWPLLPELWAGRVPGSRVVLIAPPP